MNNETKQALKEGATAVENALGANIGRLSAEKRELEARIAELEAQLAAAIHEVNLLRAELDSTRLRLVHMEDVQLVDANERAAEAQRSVEGLAEMVFKAPGGDQPESHMSISLRSQARIAELETQLAAANERANNWKQAHERAPKIAAEETTRQKAEFEALFKITLNGIREEAEGALGYEQICDAPTAVRRLAARLREAEAKVDELRQDLDVEITAKWKAQSRAETAEADAGRLRAALEEIADQQFRCEDWVCDAPAMAQAALDGEQSAEKEKCDAM